MGMGRYQWYIWSLCGLGYFLDLLWAQAFGLIASPLQHELGFTGEWPRCCQRSNRAKSPNMVTDAQLGNIFTAFSAGLTAGAFVWGILVDIIGMLRISCFKPYFLLTKTQDEGQPSTALY